MTNEQLAQALYERDRKVIRWWAETVAEIDPDAFGYPFRPLDEPWEDIDPRGRRYYLTEAERLIGEMLAAIQADER